MTDASKIRLKGTGLERNRKLSDEDIKQIKMLYKSKQFTQKELAEVFNVSPYAIYYHLATADKRAQIIKSKNAMNKTHYSKLDKNVRQMLRQKYRDSVLAYKEDLYQTRLENLLER